MTPTTGRIVFYTLTDVDATEINRRRTNNRDIVARTHTHVESQGHNPCIFGWPAGAQAHIGNSASAGDVVPLVVVRVWPDEYGPGVPGVNGQAILDGNDVLWITSAKEGTEPGTWAWPPRV